MKTVRNVIIERGVKRNQISKIVFEISYAVTNMKEQIILTFINVLERIFE